MEAHLEYSTLILTISKQCAMKLLELTWEVNTRTHTEKELIKYLVILTILIKVIFLLLRFLKL